ncbi:hypothetical protein JCM1840_004821 [Sporobolomyces johnsonii]
MAYSVSPVLKPSAQLRHPTESLSSTLVESSSPDHSTSDDSPDSASASSESDSGDSDDDDSSDDDQDPTAHLQLLLLKAKQSARERAQAGKATGKRGGEGDELAGNEEMVLFGDDDDEESDDEDADEEDGATPKASTSRSSKRSLPTLPPSLVRPLSLPSFSTSSLKGKSRASSSGEVTLAQDLSGVMQEGGVAIVGAARGKGKEVAQGNARGDKWGQAPVPNLSKKQLKANRPHTAGPQWFDMPATPMTPELKRELDALRLRNALDPKRFFRGGAKKEQVGEFFQVGHIIPSTTRATTLATPAVAAKRSFVEELLEDEQAKAYAKKKTKEVMAKGMSGRKRQRKGAKGSYAMGLGGRKGGGEAGGGKRRREG